VEGFFSLLLYYKNCVWESYISIYKCYVASRYACYLTCILTLILSRDYVASVVSPPMKKKKKKHSTRSYSA